MPAVKSLEELKQLRDKAIKRRKAKKVSGRAQIVVGMSTCGIAVGARETMKAILEAIGAEGSGDVVVKQTGCTGLCEWEPIVEVTMGDEPKVTYGKVSPERAREILREHVMRGKVLSEFVISR